MSLNLEGEQLFAVSPVCIEHSVEDTLQIRIHQHLDDIGDSSDQDSSAPESRLGSKVEVSPAIESCFWVRGCKILGRGFVEIGALYLDQSSRLKIICKDEIGKYPSLKTMTSEQWEFNRGLKGHRFAFQPADGRTRRMGARGLE